LAPLILKYLKKKIINLGLPVLNRKWDKINILTVSLQERSKQRIKEVELMLPTTKNKEIAKNLGISSAAVSQIVKRNNLRKVK
jgi:DNA-directed RNA polymerase specialized sigma subunit